MHILNRIGCFSIVCAATNYNWLARAVTLTSSMSDAHCAPEQYLWSHDRFKIVPRA